MAININAMRYAREASFRNAAQQEMLANATVLFAGCGGEGGAVATYMVRCGLGSVILADPGLLKEQGLNRYDYATTENLGQNKAEALGARLRAINPDVRIEVVPEGITEENVEDLVSRQEVSLVFDGIDIDAPEIDAKLNAAARKYGKIVVMSIAIGRGGIAAIFDPKSHYTFDKFSKAVGFVPHIPDPRGTDFIKVAKAMEAGTLPPPTTTIGTPHATSLGAALVENVLTGRKVYYAPKYWYSDIGGKKPKSGLVRFPRVHVLLGYIKTLVWHWLGLAPEIGGFGDLP